jgi:hypothetical protein
MSYIDDEELKMGAKSGDDLDDEEEIDDDLGDEIIDDDLDLEDDDDLLAEGFAGLDGSEY